MTREEAITILDKLWETQDFIHENTEYEQGYEEMQALAMAIEALSEPKVAYACDGRRCGADCSDCGRTTDIEHAKNFTKVCDSYFEKLQTEPSVSIQPKTIANNCDLISRYEALKAINGACEMWEDEAIVADILHHLPSADRPSGEWEVYKDTDGEYGICSVCGNDADFSHYGIPYTYCPSCGAYMKGGTK